MVECVLVGVVGRNRPSDSSQGQNSIRQMILKALVNRGSQSWQVPMGELSSVDAIFFFPAFLIPQLKR